MELWIPGPVPVSEAVRQAYGVEPPSHLAPDFKAAFSRSLQAMRRVWLAGDDHQPFVVAGTGTLAMETTAVNLVDPGDRVLVVNLGLFGDRMAEMLARRGARVFQIGPAPGADLDLAEVERALDEHAPTVLFATHVDTSTGARVDVQGLCALAQARGVLTAFDGVCATGAERTEQQAWGADVVFTASQKAIGLPAGLALWVCSPAAMARRRALKSPPPLVLDWLSWLPIMVAYEAEQNSYFGTPPTTLIPALDVALADLLDEGMEAVFARHAQVGAYVRERFVAAGIRPVAQTPANTLTAGYLPEGVDGPAALGALKERGFVLAGGLHPLLKQTTFRLGHMGTVIRDRSRVERVVDAVIEVMGR